ncbi:DDE superfamily endonuclease [Azotobacter beijerinckii]|nr:DDE superfamily endonuclease [Azotobacter beijerinckii]
MPEQAKALRDRFEFVYTPKHGSWLNMAEIEINVLVGQCLDRRIDSLERMRKEVAAWQQRRNQLDAKIHWQFTTRDARVKLRRLYPQIDACLDTRIFRGFFIGCRKTVEQHQRPAAFGKSYAPPYFR